MLDSPCEESSRCPFAPSSARKRLRQNIASQQTALRKPLGLKPGGHFRLPITGRQCEDYLE